MIRKDHLRNVKARKVRLKQQGDYAQTRSEEYMRRKNRYPEKFQKVQCELCAKLVVQNGMRRHQKTAVCIASRGFVAG